MKQGEEGIAAKPRRALSGAKRSAFQSFAATADLSALPGSPDECVKPHNKIHFLIPYYKEEIDAHFGGGRRYTPGARFEERT
jgi:hypothetical protein